MYMTFLRYSYSWYVDEFSFSVVEMESGCVAQAGCGHTPRLRCSSYLSLPSAGTQNYGPCCHTRLGLWF